MSRVKRARDDAPAADAASPEEGADPRTEHLRRALGARDAATRLRHADEGLAMPAMDPEVGMLLERQRYLGHLELGDLAGAEAAAARMVASGAMPDVARHEHGRVLAALGRHDEAIAAQRAAAEAAPADRRSFHRWCLASIEAQAGDLEAALRTLADALGEATRDRALLEAHAAWLNLRLGRGVADLQGLRARLRASPNREGYGQFLLGMLAHELGDRPATVAHLRAFLRRNARIDEAKRRTLEHELAAARRVLALLVSS
ncbi:MAG: hypothetical protein AAGH15_23645 [Myxococcota bacterium]